MTPLGIKFSGHDGHLSVVKDGIKISVDDHLRGTSESRYGNNQRHHAAENDSRDWYPHLFFVGCLMGAFVVSRTKEYALKNTSSGRFIKGDLSGEEPSKNPRTSGKDNLVRLRPELGK